MNWSGVWLGVIAVATLVMAAVQVGLIVVVVRLGRRIEQLATDVEREIRPVLADAATISGHAARAASLALAQVERADRLMADLTRRVDDTASVVQQTLITPLSEGRAVLAALAGALTALREIRAAAGRRQVPSEDEDPLFIG